jgi:hypothetical protein
VSWGAPPGSIGREGARLRSAVFVVVALVGLVGVFFFVRSLGRDLGDVPVSVGGSAFSVRWDGTQYPLPRDRVAPHWTAENFAVRTSRTFGGTFELEHPAAQGAEMPKGDFLFLAVDAFYFGNEDAGEIARISDILPVTCTSASAQAASCEVDGTFREPFRRNFLGREVGQSLSALWITLTWVRVYGSETGLEWQVLPGELGQRVSFNGKPTTFSGEFRDQPVVPMEELEVYPANLDFDVKQWISEHIAR